MPEWAVTLLIWAVLAYCAFFTGYYIWRDKIGCILGWHDHGNDSGWVCPRCGNKALCPPIQYRPPRPIKVKRPMRDRWIP